MNIRILPILIALAAIPGQVDAGCVQTAASVRLSVLRVESCLSGASKKGRVATTLRETLTNIGKEDIVLELHRAPTLRFRVDISRDWTPVAISPPPPVLHNPNDPWFAPKESIPLAPGASVTFSVPFSALMTEAPKRRAQYRISVTHDYPWRRPGEPEGQAFRLRLAESNAKKSYAESVLFEGVRLK